MSESFDDEDVRQEFRRSASRKKNVDYDLVAKKRELLVFARNATPDEIKAKLNQYGIEPNSSKEADAIQMYWILSRADGPSR